MPHMEEKVEEDFIRFVRNYGYGTITESQRKRC